jgi:hypothetical protein
VATGLAVTHSVRTLAHGLIATDRTDEAEKVLLGVVADRRRILGDDHAETVRAEADLRELHGG